MIPDGVRAALADYKETLQRTFGERLHRAVLFGSFARGVTHDDSDVDVLVLLSARRPKDGHRAVEAAVEVMLRRPEIVLSPMVRSTRGQGEPRKSHP